MNVQPTTTIKSLLAYIPDDKFESLARQTAVDWNAKKLTGKELFKLCLFGILNQNRASSRVFESLYENRLFQQYAQIQAGKRVSHSSIAQKIATVQVDYFALLYQHCVDTFGPKLTAKQGHTLCLYDSTITHLSASLLSFGMENGQKNKAGQQAKKSLKFTIGFAHLPFAVKFHQQQTMISEDLALGNILQDHAVGKDHIAVFDRGMKDRRRMEQLSANEQYFVTRISKSSKYQVLKGQPVIDLAWSNPDLRLISEKQVYLFDGKGRKVKTAFRLVEGLLQSSGEAILFLSNLPAQAFSAQQIAGIYKNRWQIEQFFRFIKQELNFKHYFSRHWQGIQVMSYIILIASMLLLVYKKLTGLQGYKLARISFCHALQNEILDQLILRCGGDPAQLQTVKSS